jgi:hypothetical protein
MRHSPIAISPSTTVRIRTGNVIMLRVQIKQDGKWITIADYTNDQAIEAAEAYNNAPLPKILRAKGKVIARNSAIYLGK